MFTTSLYLAETAVISDPERAIAKYHAKRPDIPDSSIEIARASVLVSML